MHGCDDNEDRWKKLEAVLATTWVLEAVGVLMVRKAVAGPETRQRMKVDAVVATTQAGGLILLGGGIPTKVPSCWVLRFPSPP